MIYHYELFLLPNTESHVDDKNMSNDNRFLQTSLRIVPRKIQIWRLSVSLLVIDVLRKNTHENEDISYH